MAGGMAGGLAGQTGTRTPAGASEYRNSGSVKDIRSHLFTFAPNLGNSVSLVRLGVLSASVDLSR